MPHHILHLWHFFLRLFLQFWRCGLWFHILLLRSNTSWQKPGTKSCSTRARWRTRRTWGGGWPVWRNPSNSTSTWSDRSFTAAGHHRGGRGGLTSLRSLCLVRLRLISLVSSTWKHLWSVTDVAFFMSWLRHVLRPASVESELSPAARWYFTQKWLHDIGVTEMWKNVMWLFVVCCCQALAEFEMYRQRMEDSQLCTEAQHTQRVVSMSREVRLDHTRTHTTHRNIHNHTQTRGRMWKCDVLFSL